MSKRNFINLRKTSKPCNKKTKVEKSHKEFWDEQSKDLTTVQLGRHEGYIGGHDPYQPLSDKDTPTGTITIFKR